MKKYKVLLAEDDSDFGSVLMQYLAIHNFDVTWERDGDAALQRFKLQAEEPVQFDICVLDVMMPKMDGFALAERLIQIDPNIPFVFLTAKKMKEDRVKGLKLGADDYIVKPFEADILVLRLQNILRRTQTGLLNETQVKPVRLGKYLFHPHNHELTIDKKVQRLTLRETQLIAFLIHRKNQLIKRDEVLVKVWGNDDFFSGRSMDVFISRLRKYFSKDPSISIESVRSVGLCFKIKE